MSMRPLFALCVVATVLLVGSACGSEATGPVIDSVNPGSAAPGATIELDGARFCGTDADVDPDGTCATPPSGSVEFGVEAPVLRGVITSWSDTKIIVGVPPAATAGDTSVVVKVNEEVSNAASFTVQ